MKHRAHKITVVIGVLVAALALTLGSSQAAVSSTIHAYFDADGHLMFTYLDGTQVSGTIPPGTYQVIYDNLGADDLAVDHAFHLSGPGLNFQPAATVVQSTFNVTFVANSTLHAAGRPAPDARAAHVRRQRPPAEVERHHDRRRPAVRRPPKSTTKAVSNDVVGADLVNGFRCAAR